MSRAPTNGNGHDAEPQVEDRRSFFARLSEPGNALKLFAGIIVAVFLAGWAVSQALAAKANASEVSEVKDRVKQLEIDLAWIKATLYQTGRAVGAPVLPPPGGPTP